ncbi:ABC transporter substrate-binding protein [Mesobacillus maritimus]|uniref:ABC transporter substrate-binding protein n=1 Tax=Mesobacillus maritimus TaxID=1643336 RepID=A0ABS7K944_9BACI|nr:ABC transporter substrate-binding protein [Mesobacillus maritimus]MBY0098788.1 ABC transporter substrate-binding protein [Mesobacillus maritimus]
MKLNKKWLVFLIVLFAFSFSGCQGSSSGADTSSDSTGDASSKDPQKLVVTSFGGAIQEAQEEYIKQFEEEYNADVEVVTLYSADALAKMRAEKNNPSLDVVLFSGGQEQIAKDEGLLMELDKSIIKNMDNLYEGAVHPDGHSVTFGYESLGLIYDENRVAAPPTSWKDLWKEEYSGNVGLVDISNTYGYYFLLAASLMEGGSEDNIQPGLDIITKLIPNTAAIVSASPEVGNLFAQEEVMIAPFDSGYAYTFAEQGVPVNFATPDEGGIGIYMTANVVQGSKNPELAQQYIDFLLRPEIQALTAEGGGYSPTNVHTELPEKLSDILPNGEESFNNLIHLDLEKVNNNRSAYTEQWNKLISN